MAAGNRAPPEDEPPPTESSRESEFGRCGIPCAIPGEQFFRGRRLSGSVAARLDPLASAAALLQLLAFERCRPELVVRAGWAGPEEALGPGELQRLREH